MIFIRAGRVWSRWRELQAVARAEFGAIDAELRRFDALGQERRLLSRPHRFVWRWYRHPLTQAWRTARRRRKARHERDAV